MYYKLFFALGIRIDDDVFAQGKGEAGIGDTIEDYLEPEFRARCEAVYPNGIDSSEIVEAFIHLKGIISSCSNIVWWPYFCITIFWEFSETYGQIREMNTLRY